MAKVMSLLFIIGMLSVTLVVYVQLDQPVRRVQVLGQLDSAERGQVKGAVQKTLDGGLLSADLEDLSRGILKLGWPRNVAIRRDWPGGLIIEVEKPAVVARWQDAYLASDGRVIRLPTERQDLPRFDCSISEPRRAMEMYLRLNEIAAGAGLRIATLTENPFGEWKVAFRTPHQLDLVVRLGAQSAAERLQRFAVVYRQHLAGKAEQIDTVDARYDNGVAVSWALEPELVARADAPRSESI
jgi:cell division protein FtsQ